MSNSTVKTSIKNLSTLVLCAFLLVMINGCRQEFDDISDSAESRQIVGVEFILKAPLVLVGVTTDPNYRGGVTYYEIMRPPGASGPEILEKHMLESGTRIKIRKVLRCNNCWFMNKLALEAEVHGSASIDKQVRIANLFRLDETLNEIVLDDRYFGQAPERDSKKASVRSL